MRAILFLFALSSVAAGQIVVPKETADRHPVVAVLQSEIPDGADVEGPLWHADKGVRFSIVSPTKIHIWADPGAHSLSFKAWWVQTEDVTFVDGAGLERTISQYLGHGYIDETAEFVVLPSTPVPGPAPGPNPPPGPEPPPSPGPGPKEAAFFCPSDSLDNLPDEQREMFASRSFRNNLEQLGHTFVGAFDPSTAVESSDHDLDPWFAAIKGDPMPRLAYRPKGGGAITDVELPATIEAVYKLLGGRP